jgi:hypothetical protein
MGNTGWKARAHWEQILGITAKEVAADKTLRLHFETTFLYETAQEHHRKAISTQTTMCMMLVIQLYLRI